MNKKKLILLLVVALSLFVTAALHAQVKTNISVGTPNQVQKGAAYAPDSSLQIPSGCGLPNIAMVARYLNVNRKGLVYQDTCAGKFYNFDLKTGAWSSLTDSAYIMGLLSGYITTQTLNDSMLNAVKYRDSGIRYITPTGLSAGLAPKVNYSDSILLYVTPTQLSAATNIHSTAYRQVWVDSALGNNSTARVGNPNFPYKNIDSALKYAGMATDTIPIVVHIGLGEYPSPKVTRGNISFWGTKSPVYNWSILATPFPGYPPLYSFPTNYLPNSGTIFGGQFIDSAYDNIELHRLGVNGGKVWCDANRAGVPTDCIMFQHRADDTTHRLKGIVLEDVCSLGYAPDALRHGILLESTDNPVATLLRTCGNTYGFVIKSNGGFFNWHTGWASSYAGLFIKNNGYSESQNVYVYNDQEYSTGSMTSFNNGGQNMINQGNLSMRDVGIIGSIVIGCTNGFNITGPPPGTTMSNITVLQGNYSYNSNDGILISSGFLEGSTFANLTLRKNGTFGIVSSDSSLGLHNSYLNINADSNGVFGMQIAGMNPLNPPYVNNAQSINSGGSYDYVWLGNVNGGYVGSGRQFGASNFHSGSNLQQTTDVGNSTTNRIVINGSFNTFGSSTEKFQISSTSSGYNYNPQTNQVIDPTLYAFPNQHIAGANQRMTFFVVDSTSASVNQNALAINKYGHVLINSGSENTRLGVGTNSLLAFQLAGKGKLGAASTDTIFVTGNLNTNTTVNLSNTPTGSAGDSFYVAHSGGQVRVLHPSAVTGLNATSAFATGMVPVSSGGTGAATFTGIIKGNGTSAFTPAVAGVDYAPATSGSSMLKGNGSGGTTNAVAGTDYQGPFTLTTSGTSGAATFDGTTLNIPVYSGGGGSGMAIGGSITGGVANSVLYEGTGGILQHSYNTFKWDSTNNRLGIGVFTPLSRVHVVSNGLTNNPTDASGLLLQDSTPATAGSPVDYSPALLFDGNSWNTTSSASNSVRFRIVNETVSGASSSGSLIIRSNINNAGYGGALLTVTSGGTVIGAGSVSGTSITASAGNITGRHFIGNSSTPGIAANAGAGTSPTISISGTDAGFRVTLTAGTTPTAAADLFTVTFANAYGATPHVSVTPINANAAGLMAQEYATTSTTTCKLTTITAISLVSAQQYIWDFVIVQ